MSSNITIELRQSDATSIQANGDYECTLSKAITISDGDVVQLSKAFVDTVRESDINIISDLRLVIKSGVYITNWYRWSNFVAGATLQDGQAYTDTPDFKHYIPYIGIDEGEIPGYSFVNNIEFVQGSNKTILAPFGLTFSYINYANDITHITVNTPIIVPGDYKLLFIPINIVAKLGSVQLISTTFQSLENAGLVFVQYNTSPIDDDIYEPFLFTTEITLPKGVYSPIQLSTYISQQLSISGLNVNVENQNMTNSKFLFSTNDFDIGRAYPDGQLLPDGAPRLLTEQTKFISDDGQVLLTFIANDPTADPPTTGPNFLMGSSQIGLEFDPNSNKFQWTQIHSNMYDATSGTDVSVRYLKYNFEENGRVMGIANNGGVFFNSLTAFDSAGKYVPFWENTLGFDLGSLCVGSSYSGAALFNVNNATFNLSNPLIVGSNITDGYYGLDSSIIRGTTEIPNKWLFRQSVPFFNSSTTVEQAQDGISSTINSTTAIIAAQPIDVLLNKFSHYILQSDLGFSNNDYIGVDFYKNINGIISKYYAYGSYCSAESEAAIQYVHRGADIQLKSMRIRLLTSNKKIDVNLGNDNTIIFQLIKAGEVLPELKKGMK
jgi:hypothetical protein